MGDINQWQFPKNEAGKVVGWSDNGKELVNRSVDDISKADAQYDKEGSLYAPDTYAIDAATKILGTPAGPRAAGKSLLHLEVVDEGSGTESSPSTAALALTAAAFKEGWPNSTAADGEIDTARFTYRQVNGDVCAILGNGAVINGFSAFFEAQILSLDPVTFATKHSIQLHAGAINDRDGGEYGYDCLKNVGQGGTAFYGYSATTAGWDYGLQLYHKEKAQLEQITSDASLRIYQFDTPANYYAIKAVSGGLQVTDNGGNIVHLVSPAATSYTPTVTASVGTITTASATGYYRTISDDLSYIELTVTVTTNGTGSLSVRATLPSGVTAAADFVRVIAGYNASGQQSLVGRIVANGTQVIITTDDGGYPVSIDGEVMYLSGVFRVA